MQWLAVSLFYLSNTLLGKTTSRHTVRYIEELIDKAIVQEESAAESNRKTKEFCFENKMPALLITNFRYCNCYDDNYEYLYEYEIDA